jgi:archaellum component FlaC
MYTAAINLSMTDIVVLNVMAIVLGIVIHLVITNRRNLQKLMRESEAEMNMSGNSSHLPAFDEMDVFQLPGTRGKKKAPVAPLDEMPSPFSFLKKEPKHEPKPVYSNHGGEFASLKTNLEQQQRSLDKLMQQMGQMHGSKKEETNEEIDMLQRLLDDKEAELQKVKSQLAGVQKMSNRIEDVYQEFDALQQKIAGLEKQAKGASELAIELEDAREAQKQIKKELVRKQEKLQEAVEESQRLYHQLGEAEDKLAEANLQRQQLMKKVQFLENLNTEFQQVSEANKKLQNELRRIGELESMLSMMTDEREILLKRRIS